MIFAAVVEQMSQTQESPIRPVGDLEAPQLVELAASSVERLLARMPAPEKDAVLAQMDTWHSWSDGQSDAAALHESAGAVKHTTVGPARTSGDDDALARACVRMAADTAIAASQCETAESSGMRERLLWKARMAAERLRMATELLLRGGPALPSGA